MADVTILPSPSPSTTPYTVATAGGDVRVLQTVTVQPTVSQGPTVGSFAGFLGSAVSWLSAAAGLASAIFPGASSFIQQVLPAVTSLFNPAAPVQPASVAAGTVPGIGPTYQNPVEVPFTEVPPLYPNALMAVPSGTTPSNLMIGAMPMLQLAGAALVRAIPALEAVVPRLIQRAPQLAGVAAAIYAAYQTFRAQGQSHASARRNALLSQGIRLRRRRMRPTNVRALRRAIRRVHGFQRVARKVGALHTSRRGHLVASHYPRRRRFFRRGDLSPFIVEDMADMADEAEDFGLDPAGFLGPGDAQEIYE